VAARSRPLLPELMRTRAEKCRMSVEIARRTVGDRAIDGRRRSLPTGVTCGCRRTSRAKTVVSRFDRQEDNSRWNYDFRCHLPLDIHVVSTTARRGSVPSSGGNRRSFHEPRNVLSPWTLPLWWTLRTAPIAESPGLVGVCARLVGTRPRRRTYRSTPIRFAMRSRWLGTADLLDLLMRLV
jgi:hypothetical protein